MAQKSERIGVPKFKTEAEEAQWWFDNREKVEDALIKAMDNGINSARHPTTVSERGSRLEKRYHSYGGSRLGPCPKAGGREGATVPDLYKIGIARSPGETRETPRKLAGIFLPETLRPYGIDQ